MADDNFGFLDAEVPKTYTPPAGYEAVHQDGMSWPRQGTRLEDTSWISVRQWAHLIAQFRALRFDPNVDVSDVNGASPFLLSTYLGRRIIAILTNTDLADFGLLALAGGNMSGPLVLAGPPVDDLDAATKGYVDAVAAGLDPKASVRAATTGNVTLSGTQTIDGVALVAGQRVLVKDQSAPAENGIYVVAAGPWMRATDADAWEELVGAHTFVEEGSTQADTGWIVTSNSGGTLDTTAVTLSKFSVAGEPLRVDITQTFNNTQKVRGLTNLGVAAGAVGDIFYRDADGLVAKLAKGAAGQKLRQNAALTAPEWESGWETITIASPSAAAAVDFTGLSAFRSLRLSGWARPATDGDNVFIRSSSNGGTSYDAGASDYSMGFLRQVDTTVSGSSLVSTAMFLNSASTVGGAAEEGIQIDVRIERWNEAAYAWFHSGAFWRATDGSYVSSVIAAQRNQATARNALRFAFSGGNIAAGRLVLMGIRG